MDQCVQRHAVEGLQAFVFGQGRLGEVGEVIQIARHAEDQVVDGIDGAYSKRKTRLSGHARG